MSDLHTSIRKSSIWMIARLGISLTVGAFVTTFIIRSLSVEEYGVYTVLYSLIGYVSVIGSFGIPDVFRRFIPEAMQKMDYSLLKRLVLRGLILRVLLSALTVGVILLLHGPIGRLLKLENFLDYFSIFAFGIVLSLEASLLTSVLHSLFLHKYSVIASTVHTVFRGACVFVLLTVGWGIWGVLWAEVVSWGMWTMIQLFFYYNQFLKRHLIRGENTPFPLRRYFRFGGLSQLNGIGDTVLGVSSDYFIITAVLGPTAVAYYAFAGRVLSIFQQVMPHRVLIDVIRPSFFTKYAQTGRKQTLSEMFNLLLKIGAFCVFPLAAGLLVLDDELISIVFKAEYLPAKPILWVLVAGMAINIVATPAALVLSALERVEIFLYNKIFAIYNIIAALLVIHWFGVMGVVIVTLSANVMRFQFNYHFARKYSDLRIDWRGLRLIAMNAVIMAVAIWPLRGWVTGLISLVMVAAFGALIFLLASWLNKGFSAQERTWINRVAPRPVFAF